MFNSDPGFYAVHSVIWRMLTLTSLLATLALSVPADAAASDNCQLQISNSRIDYGHFTRAQLLARQNGGLTLPLGKQTLTLTALCRQPALLSVFFRGSAADGDSYRFDTAGRFTLMLSNAQMDGRAVQLGQVQTAGQMPENIAGNLQLRPSNGAVAVIDQQQVKGSSFSVQVEVAANISAARSRVKDRTQWNGNGNFELIEN